MILITLKDIPPSKQTGESLDLTHNVLILTCISKLYRTFPAFNQIFYLTFENSNEFEWMHVIMFV